MTAARQERKSPRLWAAAATAGLLLLAGISQPGGAATTEVIVSDYHSGLAISGFDPVAYFTDGAAMVGREDLEVRYGGVTWRFRNVGNRAAFEEHPDIYMPQFGGYDPISVGRGASAPGHPELWLITDEKLFLFYSEAARNAFAQHPARAIDAAERHWPDVLKTLTP
jgi:hypothetical protein